MPENAKLHWIDIPSASSKNCSVITQRISLGVFAFLSFVSAGFVQANDSFDPPALYLSWQRDPTTSMTIQWHTLEEARTTLFYRELGTAKWQRADGDQHELPGSIRTVHTIELTGLKPKQDYEFCFWPSAKVFKFRTMPSDLKQPVRFVTGGDVYHERAWMDNMNKLAARFDPAFVVFGGDLAYACDGSDKPDKMERWDAYFDSWKKCAVTEDGRLIPMIVTIGNHEVRGSLRQPPERAAVFYSLFATPGKKGYARLDFSSYLTLLLMDSAHIQPVIGDQTTWLGESLRARKKVPHIFPFYHVPAYPSYRSDTNGSSAVVTQEIRANWCPLFERYGVQVAFEHHDHTFKRTHPIKAGKIDPKGIVYIGDGCWGVGERKPEPSRWYLAKAAAARHFYVVTLYPEARHVTAVNERGQIFDEIYQER